MKAAVVRDPFGLENLKIEDVRKPVLENGDVRVKINLAGVNPIDLNIIRNKTLYRMNPVPHIPGSEATGTILEGSKSLKRGERVIIYPRLFDGTCEMCVSGREYMCTHGGLFGVATNGAYCEEVSLPEKNLIPYPKEIGGELAASLSVGGLTAYHGLRRAGAREGQKVLVYGASGNTGIFAVQIAAAMGMEVDAVSSRDWVSEYVNGTAFRSDSDVTGSYDVIVNSLGSVLFAESTKHLAIGGSLVTFGALTGTGSELDIGKLYTRENSVVGSTGGSRSELLDLLKLLRTHKIRIPVEKIFPLDRIHDAMELFQKRSSGRILIRPA